MITFIRFRVPFILLFLVAISSCGGGGGSSTSSGVGASVTKTSASLVEVSSFEIGALTASWLPASNDSAIAQTLTYELHLNTPEGNFIPTDQTLKFRGKAVLSTKIEDLQPGTRYSVKLVVEDASGNRNVGTTQSIKISEATPELILGTPVVVLGSQDVVNVDPAGMITTSASSSVPAPGTILAGEANGGFLREVVTTQQQPDGSTSITTEPVSLNEVVSNLDLSTSVTLTPVPETRTSSSLRNSAAVNSFPAHSLTRKWPQSGFTLESTKQRDIGVVRKAASAKQRKTSASSISTNPNIDANSTQVIGASEFLQITGPSVVAIVGGNSGQIPLEIKIQKDDETLLGRTVPLTICEMKLNAVKHPDGNENGLVHVQALETIEWDNDTGATKVARANIHISSTEQQISSVPYKMYLKVFADGVDSSCQHAFGWSYRDAIPIELEIIVVSIPGFPENQTDNLSFQGGFTVGNTIEYTFNPTLEADVRLQNRSLEYARFEAFGNASFKQTLFVNAALQGNLDDTKTLFGERTFVKVFMVGSVPIVMSGDFKIDMRIQGDVTGELNATETLIADFPKLAYGFKYIKGQGYQPIKDYQQTFGLIIKGSGDAQANLQITLLPSMNVRFYNAATGRIVLAPELNAEAGIHGEVSGAITTGGSGAGADYWLSKGHLSAAASAWVMAELEVLDYTIAKWPDTANSTDYTSWRGVPLLDDTPVLGLPVLHAEVDYSESLSGESRAILIRGIATNIANPLKPLLGVGPDAYIEFSNWNSAEVVELTADGYSLRPGINKGEYWFIPTKPGDYTARLGGYSSLGGWSRQIIDIPISITDDDNDGLLDHWEMKYGISDITVDADGDGLTNLEEFQQGRNPISPDAAVASLDTDSDGMPDAWETANGLDPYSDDANGDIDGNGISNLVEYQQSLQDTQPPSVPVGLTAIAVSSSQINLTWDTNTESDLAGYDVYKGGALLKAVFTNTESDIGLSPSTEYCYTLAAYDTSENRSNQTNQICATTLTEITPPTASTSWEWVKPLPQGNSLTKVIWSGSQFVAVGKSGAILTSPDGVVWTLQDSGITNDLNGIAWSGNQFVAVGWTTILTSPDGVIWTVQSSDVTYLSDIIWNGSQFVAVGYLGSILTSLDGVTWTTQISGTNSDLNSITWNGSQFVAVGYLGSILTSHDGVSWISRSYDAAVVFTGITWSGNQFVAVGWGGVILTSPDGVSWTSQSSGTTKELNGIVWSGSQFVAVGVEGVEGGSILTSLDGVIWTAQNSGTTYPIGITWNGSQFIAVGVNGAIIISQDGLTWTLQVSGIAKDFMAVAWNGSQFVAVGWTTIFSSTDGVIWTEQSFDKNDVFAGIVWNGSQFVVVAWTGTIITSQDGVTWTTSYVANSGLIGITWNGSQFVAVGGEGTILTSPDGVAWTVQNSGTSFGLLATIWSGSQFVAVGVEGTIVTSPDGITWTGHNSGTTNNLNGITWNGSQFVAVGWSGTIITSQDGVTWTGHNSGTTNNLKGITWSGSQFVAVGWSGTIITSQDGVTWEALSSGTSIGLQAIIWNGNQFVTVGQIGTILRCDGNDCLLSESLTGSGGTLLPNPEGYLEFVEGNPGIQDDGNYISSSVEDFSTYSVTTDPKPTVGTYIDGVTITVVSKLPRDDAFAQIYYEFGYSGTECLVRVDDNDIARPQNINSEATYYSFDIMSSITTDIVRAGVSTGGVRIQNTTGCDVVEVSDMFLNRIEFLNFSTVPVELDAIILDAGIVNR